MADLPNPAQAINNYVTLGTGTESGSVWMLHAPARPAVPPQQLPGALHGVADVEQPPDQRLDPAECPPYPWSGHHDQQRMLHHMRAEQYVAIDGYVTWIVLGLAVIGGVLTLIIR